MSTIATADLVRVVLPNGLPVLLKPLPGTGATSLFAFAKAGGMLDGDRPGLARFVGSMLMHGTRARSAQQLAEDLDAIGASLSAASGLEITTVVGRALSADLPVLVAAAAEVLLTPTFPPDETEKIRGQLVTAVRVNALDTRAAAERLFRRMTYPVGHPHSRPPDGDETVLTSLTPGDLLAFHGRHFTPEEAAVIVAGEIDGSATMELIQQAFGGWRSTGAWALPRFTPPAPLDGPRRASLHLPGKTQADLVLGGPGVARTDDRYYAVMMANLVLGQLGMMGRIGESVRERQGMAYYAYSDLRAALLDGPWWVRAGVNPANVDRAVTAIVHEIRTLQHDGPEDDELTDARRFLVGSLAVRLETTQGIAQALADVELYGLGLDYLERYPSIIEGVSRDAIMAAINQFPIDGYVLAVAAPEPSPAADSAPRSHPAA